VFPYVALSSLAGLFSCALWLTGILAGLQRTVLSPIRAFDQLTVPETWIGVASIFGVSLIAAALVGQLGARAGLRYLGFGFVALTVGSFLAAWFLSVDLLFLPLVIAGFLSASASQLKRVRGREIELTKKLRAASGSFESTQIGGPEDCLRRGLQLLDTVLSPSEAVVFQRDRRGQLSSAARLRATQHNALDTSRNSTWREGINLCERAIKQNEMIV